MSMVEALYRSEATSTSDLVILFSCKYSTYIAVSMSNVVSQDHTKQAISTSGR
jgi:hypothetical protein